MGVEDFVVFFRVLSPVLLSHMAWIVWRTPYQERVNRLLAAFLAVLAFGFWIELLWDIFRTLQPDAERVLRRVQDVAGYVDPPLLLCFALVLAGVGGRPLLAGVGAVYGAAGVFLLAAGARPGLLDADLFSVARNLYVNATYLAVLAIVWTRYAAEPRRFTARQLHFLTLGVGFAALSRMSAFFIRGGPRQWYQETVEGQVGAGLALALLALVAVALGVRANQARLGRSGRRVKTAGLWLTVIIAGFFAFWYVAIKLTAESALQPLASYYFNFRWVIFAGIVGYGVLRYQLFDFALRTRQVVSIFGVTLAMIAVAIVAGVALREGGVGLLAARLLGLAIAAAIGVPTLVVLQRRRGATHESKDPQFTRRRLEIYEATLEYALGKTDWTDEERRFVETLREVFEVTPEEHERVLAALRPREESPRGHAKSGTTG